MIKDLNGTDMARKLSDFVNIMGGRKRNENFAKEIVNKTHRTLQQGIFGLFMYVVAEWAKAEEENNFDGRNEFTVKTCKKIVKENPDLFYNGKPVVPCI